MPPRNKRKPKVVFEWATPRKEDRPSSSREMANILPPFVLGMMVALLLILTPLFSGAYFVCKDLDITPESKNDGELHPTCPNIHHKTTRTTSPKKGFPLFRKKQPESFDDALLLHVTPPDPIHGACQVWWGALAKLWLVSEFKVDSAAYTCRPERASLEHNDTTTDKSSSPPSVSESKSPTDLKIKYKTAFTPEALELPDEQKQLIGLFAKNVREAVPDLDERASRVSWGGSNGPAWFVGDIDSSGTDLEAIEGGHLYYSYLRIMQWPKDLYAHFPFKLCSKGCDSNRAIQHTLEFREKYQPWLITPTMKQENANGMIYTHGFSPSLTPEENGSHSVVWVRIGNRNKIDDLVNIRLYINSLERAVAASLERSNGRVGKFNTVVDGKGFSLGLLPSVHNLKIFVTILQDHFPNRLGIILLTNLGRVGEILVKLILPLITEEVRNKIVVLPHQADERREVLDAIVGRENIPSWLGGTDPYEFDVEEYYSQKDLYATDEAAKEYLDSMPYHS